MAADKGKDMLQSAKSTMNQAKDMKENIKDKAQDMK